MKVLKLFITILFSTGVLHSQNLILNGSFENNNATTNSVNLTTAWSTTVADCFEVDFGSMDLITSNTCGTASDGNWFVTCSPTGSVWPYLAFSFKLNSTLTFGAQYTLTFDKRYCGPNTSPIDIGLSNDSTLMGTAVHTFTAPLSNTWSSETYVFQAMLAANYLTVNIGVAGGTGTVGLDNFNLQPVVTGFDEAKLEEYKIFPNPSNGVLSISTKDKVNTIKVEVFNMVGDKVYQVILKKNELKIDVSCLPKGIYFIKIDDGEKKSIKKIILQ